ncbi:MAG: PIG-L family deacetylase [Chloroflexia bacterium]
MSTTVYLSPHFDDMALSVGGLAATGTDAGGYGLCITLFAAPPAPGLPLSGFAEELHARWGEPDPVAANALRRAEEQAATRLLGLDLLALTYADAVYRHGRYNSVADIFGAVHADEAALPAAIAAALDREIGRSAGWDGVTVYAPLGLGGHVDHQLTFCAARIMQRAGRPVRYYEDFPYAAVPDALSARLAALRPARATPTYHAITATLDRKIAAIAAYPSQISSLFLSQEAMPAAVRDYAAAVAAEAPPAARVGGYAERTWEVAGEPA